MKTSFGNIFYLYAFWIKVERLFIGKYVNISFALFQSGVEASEKIMQKAFTEFPDCGADLPANKSNEIIEPLAEAVKAKM